MKNALRDRADDPLRFGLISKLALLSGLAFPFPFSGGIYLPHVVMGVFSVGYIVRFAALHPRSGRLSLQPKVGAGQLVLVIVVSTVLAVLAYGVPARFWEEMPKFLLILGAAAYLRCSFSPTTMARMLELAAWTLGVSVALHWLLASGAASQPYEGRLYIPLWGSPNTLALLAGGVVLVMLDVGRDGLRRRSGLFLNLGLVALMLVVVYQTDSRGGMVSLLVAIAAWHIFTRRQVRGPLGRWFRLLLLGIAAVLLVWWALGSDVDGEYSRYSLSGGDPTTGRLEIWWHLLAELTERPESFIWGLGAGSIDLRLFSKDITSAHSVPLTFLFYFGLPALLIVVALSVKAVNVARTTGVHRDLRFSLMTLLVVSSLVDNVILSAQALLPVALWLSVVVNAESGGGPSHREWDAVQGVRQPTEVVGSLDRDSSARPPFRRRLDRTRRPSSIRC